jgi:hypothetical protein
MLYVKKGITHGGLPEGWQAFLDQQINEKDQSYFLPDLLLPYLPERTLQYEKDTCLQRAAQSGSCPGKYSSDT